MVTKGLGESLLGRRSEREVLDRLLAAVRGGRSGVLVVRGEPGVGKTALLQYAVEAATGFLVARAVGVESEMELPFAGLQQLCAPMLDRLERLPGPQREALRVAYGLSAGDPPDRFLVGLATLSLLSAAAEEQPLLCVVDDAQWLDRASAQTLAFVARRLLAEPVGIVFGAREPSEGLRGMPELALGGLRNGDARTLLNSAIRGLVDERVLERMIAETRGNPLALLELPRGLTAAELAGGFGLPDAPALSQRIEESFRARLALLRRETQRLLLVAAAEPLGDPVLVWRAAEHLGVGVGAAADTDGLLAIGARVTFRHPLVRSSVYQAASEEERQAAHRALAEATDPHLDPDRRAWHLAQATRGFDEEVACELERSAGRARARGGVAAAAAFRERATELTPDPARRAQRALTAAQAKHHAGVPDAALRLLGAAKGGPLDELQRARAHLLEGQIAFASNRGGDAASVLLDAAKRLEPLDPSLARETYAEALAAATYAGRLAKGDGLLEVAEAVRAAPHSGQPLSVSELLIDGQAVLITEGPRAAAPILKRALSAFAGDGVSNDEALRWLWLACQTAIHLWDHESWRVLSDRYVQLAREAGALTVLPLALNYCAGCRVYSGELVSADALGEEARAVGVAISNPDVSVSSLFVAAWRGAQTEASLLIEASDRDAAQRGEGRRIDAGRYATAVLYNGLGRYELALTAAQQALEYPRALPTSGWVLPEQVEAASRSGKPEVAARALAQLSEITRVSGTDWALGIESRSRALISEGEIAESLYSNAIDRLRRTRVRSELARCHLLYGEWLRRENRRLDARDQLRSAHEQFTAFGMKAFAERARVELEATGEHARKRTDETRDDLTPQEAQISRLAADGATNQDIAAQLFISPSTVDYHLRKAFRKLEVKSRHQLKQHLLEPAAHWNAARTP
jgi:DNA-binding CsgD family transcriptional regulator